MRIQEFDLMKSLQMTDKNLQKLKDEIVNL